MKFKNGLFSNIDYYAQVQAVDYVLRVSLDKKIAHITGADFYKLVVGKQVTSSVIDTAVAMTLRKYVNIVQNVIGVTCLESKHILQSRFSMRRSKSSLNPGGNTLILPLEVTNDDWALVISNVREKTYFCYDLSGKRPRDHGFDNFIDYAAHWLGSKPADMKRDSWKFQTNLQLPTFNIDETRTNSAAFVLYTIIVAIEGTAEKKHSIMTLSA